MTDYLSPSPLGDAVKRSIADALHQIPDGKRAALVVIADLDGARVMVAAKFGSHWKVAAETSKPWTGPISASISIEGSW